MFKKRDRQNRPHFFALIIVILTGVITINFFYPDKDDNTSKNINLLTGKAVQGGRFHNTAGGLGTPGHSTMVPDGVGYFHGSGQVSNNIPSQNTIYFQPGVQHISRGISKSTWYGPDTRYVHNAFDNSNFARSEAVPQEFYHQFGGGPKGTDYSKWFQRKTDSKFHVSAGGGNLPSQSTLYVPTDWVHNSERGVAPNSQDYSLWVPSCIQCAGDVCYEALCFGGTHPACINGCCAACPSPPWFPWEKDGQQQGVMAQ